MENAFKSLSSSAKSPSFMASNKHYHGVVNHQPPFPQPPATPPQPPLLPLPARPHAPPPQQHAAWPAPQRSKKPSHATATAAAAAAALGPKKTAPVPIPVQAAPSKKRAAAASQQEAAEWTTTTDSLHAARCFVDTLHTLRKSGK
ncbi:Os09g0539000 [Oryza sativa Japonica Group]|uniref:Os09g0539000 protein n=1 Tax=Oryza sativa subsp. japonica TaxID=39947 RepID=C7J6Z9_ORYSJ|nr:Os09g0539000 [Oryza sativa Japonica Group]|eukprot:NP_001175962.1 Os09g0539000 [Oryza sativa Japonica Group]